MVLRAQRVLGVVLSSAALIGGGLAQVDLPQSDRTGIGQPRPGDWPCYNQSPNGWRYNAAEKTLGPQTVGEMVELWRFPTAESEAAIGVVHATPTVVGGEVYFGTATFPAFYKLSAGGELLWKYVNPRQRHVEPPSSGDPMSNKLLTAASDGGIFSSALVHDGAVFFADTGGWVYCLDAATGEERWKRNTRGPKFPDAHWNNLLMASPIFSAGNVVFGGGTLEQLFAGTPQYAGSTGRGFLVALDPTSGEVKWKHDVGEKPRKLQPRVVINYGWGDHAFAYGPATSSVWSTPSYDPVSGSLFFGTDVNTAPRQPTPDDPRLHTADSCAVRAIDARTGELRWNTQLNAGDVWTNSMRAYDPEAGRYKDASVGDTPKVLELEFDGRLRRVVGVGCKNGGFYLLDARSGELLRHTPLYDGPPTEPPAPHDARVLALPSPIGGLQTGCATDGGAFYVNGIDAVRLATLDTPHSPGQVPTGGRVTAVSGDLLAEHWRHERPKIAAIGGTAEAPAHRDVGDIVAAGIAVGNGVAWFTTVGTGRLVAVATATGKLLREFELGPVFCGPSLSHGRVFVGGGNTLFTPHPSESFFPKRYTGSVRCFGLPASGADERAARSTAAADNRLAEKSKPRRLPNVIYVLADDMGVGDASCYNPDAAWRTQHIDRLAAEGMRFTDAHSGSAVCTPTRYGVITGRYAWRSRLKRGVLGGASSHLIDPARLTVARLLQGHGYHTACLGKWHLGMDFTYAEGKPKRIDFAAEVTNGPDVNGFDYYYCHNGSLDMAPYVYVENGRITALPNRVTANRDHQGFWRKGKTGADFVHEDVLPNLTRRAVSYVHERARTGQPFFLYLPLPAPHTPILPTPEYRGKSGINPYGDFVLQVDATVGALLAAIERAGVSDDTLFVFTCDNGCSPRADFEVLEGAGHHPSGPFRGHKADIYEGGHRVPFVVRWPARVAKGSRCDQTVCLTDLLRTCADIVGAEVPPTAGEDSVSLLPALTGDYEGPLREATVHHSINGSFAIRQGRYKLVLCPGSGGWSAPRPAAARKQRMPLYQLFDLVADPGERRNLATADPAIVRRLTELLTRYVERGRSTPGPRQKNEGVTRFLPKPYAAAK